MNSLPVNTNASSDSDNGGEADEMGKGCLTWVKPLAALAIAAAMLLSPEEVLANDNHGGGGEHGEHAAVMALTQAHHANFLSAQSGAWSDANTWTGGEVPSENAQVMVAYGHTVVFDIAQADRMEWVRVDGILQFDHTADTRMYVETLVVAMHGKLTIGTEANPIGEGVTARITIADAGEDFDHSVDIHELGRGVITMGRVEMHGADATPYTGLAKHPTVGDAELVIDGQVENWRVGDKLVTTRSEILYIAGISQNEAGQTVIAFDKDLEAEGVQGLAHDHTPPEGYGLTHYVANLDRNVVIESENPDIIDRRGHVMFMHNQNVDIRNAGFYGLGRTDKGRLINDVSMDGAGNMVPGTNVRGRYSVHFHRAGVSTDDTPGHVEGCVVVDSPGWGYVNHDSYVNMYDSIAYHVKGTAFAQEFGNELGTFTRNLAINTYGGTRNWRSPIPDRQPLFDWGFAGHGFWMHSASVSLVDNIAAASGESGFAYFGKGKGAGRASVTNFIGNVNIGAKVGVLSWEYSRPRIVFEDFTVWNTGGVLYEQGFSNIEFKDSLFIGSLVRPRGEVIGIAYGGGYWIDRYVFDNTTIVGWERINPPYPVNSFVVRGGYYANVQSFLAVKSTSGVRFEADPESGEMPLFGELTTEQLDGRTQEDIRLTWLNGSSIEVEEYFIASGAQVYWGDQQIYHERQAADASPLSSEGSWIPEQLLGKTNQQILDEYGLAYGGGLAPADAVRMPRVNGLLGERMEHTPPKLLSPKWSNDFDGYLLSFQTAGGQVITETEPIQLQEFWNLITRDIDGTKNTVFVYGDITAPHFVESERFGGIQRSVSYGNLHKALRIYTTVWEVSIGSQKLKFTLRGLHNLPMQLNYKNEPYVIKGISYRDKAGNVGGADVKVRITGAPSELPPYAATDNITVIENTTSVIDVLANDSDPHRSTPTLVSVAQPGRGTALVSDGRVLYTPNAGYMGAASFTYTITNKKGLTDSATVNVQVDPLSANSLPEAVEDSAGTVGQSLVTIDVLGNDSDPDGALLTIAGFSQGSNGTVVQDGDKLVYTAAEGFVGTDTFTYAVTDGSGESVTSRVTVTVEPVPEFANLALKGRATQSSTQWGGYAERAIDGNTDNDWNSETITATFMQQNPWWAVNLEERSDLKEIKLWNRADPVGWSEWYLRDFRVTVYDGDTEVFAENFLNGETDGHVDVTGGFDIDLPEGVTGDRVMVQLNGTGVLFLAEVEVRGQPPMTTEDPEGGSGQTGAPQEIPDAGTMAIRLDMRADGADSYPVVSFRRRKGNSLGFTYQVDESCDLLTWDPVSLPANEISVTTIDESWEKVTVRGNRKTSGLGSASCGFLRVRIVPSP